MVQEFLSEVGRLSSLAFIVGARKSTRWLEDFFFRNARQALSSLTLFNSAPAPSARRNSVLRIHGSGKVVPAESSIQHIANATSPMRETAKPYAWKVERQSLLRRVSRNSVALLMRPLFFSPPSCSIYTFREPTKHVCVGRWTLR